MLSTTEFASSAFHNEIKLSINIIRTLTHWSMTNALELIKKKHKNMQKLFNNEELDKRIWEWDLFLEFHFHKHA